MKNFEWLNGLKLQRVSRSARSRRRPTTERAVSLEMLEARTLLTSNPVLAAITDVTVLSGSPLHIPLNATDADGHALTYSASSTNSDLTTYIPEGNRSIAIDVQNFGEMTFELFEDKAPRATEQIITLADSGFYNGSTFHRVIDNFVIQGGDPNGNPVGTGGSTLGDFDDQFHPDLQHNRTGMLSMAKSNDDTNDSQVFVTEGAQRHLDSQHTVFGILVEGESVREAISGTPVTNSVPDTPVIVNSISVFSDIENSVLMLSAPEGTTGSASITVTVTDPDGNQDQQTFNVTIETDPNNNQPFLADIPAVRTLVDTPTAFQLSRIDLEGNTATFLDEELLQLNGLFVPETSHTSLNYQIDSTTGAVTVTPTSGLTGTHNVTAAVGEFPSAIDYQLVPIEIVSAATTWTVSADLHPNGNEADDGAADTFRVVRNGSRLEVHINGTLSAQAEAASVLDLVINGSGDDDILIIDGSGGDPLPASGFTFSAGSQASVDGDRLHFVSGSVTSVNHAPSSTTFGSGTITVDGVSSQFSGIEGLVDSLIAVNRTFDMTDGDEVIAVGDDATPADGISRLLNGGTALPISFADPTGSLTINAGAGNDRVTINALDGGAIGATLNGGDGSDTLVGGTLGDVLNGGADNDVINGNAGSDTAKGGDGNDTILGGGSSDFLEGNAGNDRVLGHSGDDTLEGGAGDDFISGSSGNDRLRDAAVEALQKILPASYDGNGLDTLDSIEEALIEGNELDNRIDANSLTGSVTLRGNGGGDTLIGAGASDLLEGGDGDDVLFSHGGTDVIDGGVGNDTLNGGGDGDTLIGGAGDDNMAGGAGRDSLDAGDGNDRVMGQGSTGDTLRGGAGDDTLDGGAGDDVLIDSANADFILTNTSMTGNGNDTVVDVERAILIGGSSSNLIDASAFFSPGQTTVTLRGGGGNDTLIGTAGADALLGDRGADSLVGGDGHDKLNGASGRDTLLGGNGNDRLRGQGSSFDWLSGGLGDDTLDGGAGTDVIMETLIDGVANEIGLDNDAMFGLGTDVILRMETASLTGSTGNDTISIEGFTPTVAPTIRGGSGNDQLIGSDFRDILHGEDGNDILSGLDGDDILRGGAGDDHLDGNSGDDGLSGGSGNDTVKGNTGDDIVYAGSGNDSVRGGDGLDTLFGGADDDDVDGEGDVDQLAGGSGTGSADAGDVVTGLAEEIDEAFQLNPVPAWVEEV